MQKDYKIVKISDIYLSKNSEDTIITYSLGSCLGLTLYDPVKCVGGLIHCLMPLSSNEPEKAKENPYMYVDTGLVKMLEKLINMGAEMKNMICKVAGCAAPLLEDNNMFRIGDRNYAVMKKILWKNNILIKGEHVGGKHARTMILFMGTGKTIVKIDGIEEIEL